MFGLVITSKSDFGYLLFVSHLTVTDAADGRGALPLLLCVVCQYQNHNAAAQELDGSNSSYSSSAGSSGVTVNMLNVLLKRSILRLVVAVLHPRTYA
jgi:hypothetical protein